jgi:hypothetical protein
MLLEHFPMNARPFGSSRLRTSLLAGLVLSGALGLAVAVYHFDRPATGKPLAEQPLGRAAPVADSDDVVSATFQVARPSEPKPVIAAAVAPQPPDTMREAEPKRAPPDENGRFVDPSGSLEARLQRAQERDELNARWVSEQADPQWGASVERRMHSLLSENGVLSRSLSTVDCRQTICRLQLRSANESQKSVTAVLAAARALHEETWVLPEEDEASSTYSVDVFMPRDGYRLSGGGGKVDSAPITGEATPIAEPGAAE